MLFNNLLSEGIFPECFKTAKIIPIFKYGDSNSTVNYKPISMLPFLSKIFEKLMCARLDFYLKSNNILRANQFGKIQILQMQLLNSLIMFIHSKKSPIAVYIDFSKAFDTVSHNILMSKFLHNGVRGVMQHWFESYLSNRKQYISIKNCSCSMSNITLGVPQGSVLGQVLFLLYINDMYRSSNQMSFVHFADDTTAFASDSTQVTHRL